MDLSNSRIFTPAEMKAKGKRFAEEAQRTQAGKNLKGDNVRLVDPAAVKALARKLYTSPDFAEWEPAFDKAMAS